MIIVPLTAMPDQRLQMILGNQDVSLRVYTRDDRLYTDLAVAGSSVWQGFIARNLLPCKFYPYLSFIGQLVFVDMQGLDDPQWAGLGARWLCLYLNDAEVAAIYPERNP